MALKLTYFGIPGRAYVARTCFGLGGVAYENVVVNTEQFVALKGPEGTSDACPMGSLPVLTLPSGKTIVESGAICRYAARLGNLFPTDPEQALVVDETFELCATALSKKPSGQTDEEEEKTKWLDYANGPLKKVFSLFARRLSESGGPFLLGAAYGAGDISIYGLVKIMRSAFFEHIPADYGSAWPEIEKLVETLEADPKFAPYKL